MRIIYLILVIFSFQTHADNVNLLWNAQSWNSSNWSEGDNSDFIDTDNDGVLNIYDNDDDNDGIADTDDTYPLVAIGDFVDTDNDGAPDECGAT